MSSPADLSPAETTPVDPPPRRRNAFRTAVQFIGVLGSIALLGWCISQAFKPENRQQLQHLADAPAHQVAILLALSAAYILVNACILWCGIRPTRKLRFADVAAVQCICVVLGYLPLKLATIFRALVHNRRDCVPVLTIGAWLANAFNTLLMVVSCVIGASLIHKGIDAIWVAIVAGLLITSTTLLVLFCRFFAGPRGLARFIAIADRVPGPLFARIARSKFFGHVHEGFAMLADPRWTAACVCLRLVDIGVQSARFWLAGSILGVGVSPEQSIMIASSYFLIGILSPTGALGAREAGSTGLAAALGIAALHAGQDGQATFAVVALTVSASEAVVALCLAALGVVWLRPDRLITRLRNAA